MPAGPKEAIGKGCAKYTGFLGTETPAEQNQPSHGDAPPLLVSVAIACVSLVCLQLAVSVDWVGKSNGC